MSSLTAAHRGYEYQDLLVACRLVDVLLGRVVGVHVDEKLSAGDRFDDLSTIDLDGRRERTQFKHTENADRLLALETFTTDARGLRLDFVIASILGDRSGPGRDATSFLYRIVLRDSSPVDPALTTVLGPVAEGGDPGPFIPGSVTRRFRFDAAVLWTQRDALSTGGAIRPFSFLADYQTLTRDDLAWACQYLVIEVSAPPASADLTAPDIAERLLLNRVRNEVGAEAFPNLDRSAVDVAAGIISTARAARQGRVVVTTEELLRRAQLRSDFGAVSRAHPVDREFEVSRSSAVLEIVEAATEISAGGGHLVVVGPPGQGKSWICQQVLDAMYEDGWLTAEHYCYLGDADGERNKRVLVETVFGSLLGRLGTDDPSIIADQRPKFAADEEALEGCLRRSLAKNPDRRVALVIDGIDHITRVRARMGDRFDPSKTLVEALSALDVPAGVVVIVLSQPGRHLQPLDLVGARTIDVPGLSKTELELLSARFNIVPGAEMPLPARRPLLEDADGIARFLEELERRSSGNALYATYLCRETLRQAETLVDPAETVRNLPQFDGTLKNYYDHLYNSLGAETGWVADVIALVDFAVTRAELRQIRPDAAHRVDAALALLAPVLVERATQGGVRVYHESFARYLRSAFDRESPALSALLDRIAAWLEEKGLFVDPRSFRSLLSILADSGNDRRVIDLVDRAFVAKAIAAGFPSSAIAANLAIGVGSAARLSEWGVIVQCVELARAAQMYEYERFDSLLVSFADVPAKLIGADTLATRLIDDDRLVMAARAGLQMCASVDRLGAAAPWRPYMLGHIREAKNDNTAYGEASDRAVELAWMRGRLRLSSMVDLRDPGEQSPSLADAGSTHTAEGGTPGEQWDLAAPIDWARLAARIEHADLPMSEVIDAVVDTYGSDGVIDLIHALKKPGEACLAYAEKLATQVPSEEAFPSPRTWAVAAVAHGVRAGSIHRVLKLGVRPGSVANQLTAVARERLLDLTRAVQEPSIQFDKNGNLDAWLDAATLAAYLDEDALRIAEVLIAGEGWYRCWLRFALALSKAEGASTEKSQLALNALRLLTEDLRPFAGDPRACDLYSLRGAIHDTITRAIHLLEDANWEEGLKILDTVSSSITTTLSGELGGPVAPDFLLRLAVETATPRRYRAAEALIGDEIAKGSARRYYSDLAEYRLVAARLALSAEDMERAAALWREACEFLTAYGYHKDITIYEVLDPLPALIRADPQRGRLRVAAVQGLCERVPLHTDKKDTRGAWSRWWDLLAKADPVAAVDLAAPTLLRKCNDPYELLDDALEDVWEQWYEHVDPLISGALRLSLDKPLDRRHREQLKRLAEDTTTNRETIRQLMTWLVARADERPVSYSYSNGAELLAKDDIVVADLNQIAMSADVPVISPIERASTPRSEAAPIASPDRKSKNSTADVTPYSPFPDGLPGLSRAIRTWRRKPHDAQSEEWAVERFTNVIGYRLVELSGDGRLEEAESALRSLGDSVTLGDPSGILRYVAEGLERHRENRLAAVAYTLAWTRARGRGGWMTFGGQTELDSLEHASTLDAGVARAVVAEEVEHAVAASYGPYGISQALVFAFASEALRVNGSVPLDTAFAVWDEAFAVISARAPRVSDDDDPNDPYLPSFPDAGQAAPGNLDAAFALAILASLFHPSRERKRRTLLATQLLIEQRPDVIASAVSFALSTISDPATLVWLLGVIELSGERGAAVVAACQPVLRELSSRALLTVRALARRLLDDGETPLVPSSVPDLLLLAGGGQEIWTPVDGVDDPREQKKAREDFVNAVAGDRLRRGERLLPGLTRAVQERLASSLESESVRKRVNSQLDRLGDRVRKRWPDAFLANEETIEATLQSVAAGGRAAKFATGNMVTNGAAWEDNLASSLADGPEVPLILEATRQPRPPILPPPGNGDEIWGRIRERAQGKSTADSGIVEAADEEGVLIATVHVEPHRSAQSVEHGAFKGWRWLGTVEKRWMEPADWRDDNQLFAMRYRVLEVRDVDDRQALNLSPVASGDLRMWKASIDPVAAAAVLHESQPLIGVDRELRFLGDGREGLGAPPAILVPTAALIISLALEPGEGCAYEDRDGIGMALVTWRAEYDRSDYYLARPRIRGSGIVIRPDLFDRLVDGAGDGRLVMRDFVVGSAELAAKPVRAKGPPI
jgi:hypothetical protein